MTKDEFKKMSDRLAEINEELSGIESAIEAEYEKAEDDSPIEKTLGDALSALEEGALYSATCFIWEAGELVK